MKTLLLAVAIVAVPRVVLAVEQEHPWSVGAGVGFGVFSPLSSQFVAAPPPPIPVFTVQRALSGSTAVVLGLSAEAATRDYGAVVLPAGLAAFSGASSFGIGASVGLLHELTGEDAPVRFSVVGSVFGGYGRSTASALESDGSTSTAATGKSWVAGVRGGFALDKPLLDRLALRLTANVLSAGYTASSGGFDSVDSVVQAPRDTSGFDGRISIEPSLELRFEF